MSLQVHGKSLTEVEKCKEPLIFRSHLDWDILQWDVSQWRDLFKSETKKTFRKGPFICSKDPLWERKCSSVQMGMDEFFNLFSSDGSDFDGWLYFDYKHISDHLTPEMASKLNFTWGAVGFPDKSAKDSTIWIGTVGSHTPCHVDTYGCNFVGQIFGKKRWLLFPPSEACHLNPTRVPYEESSVYSSFNFFRGCAPFPAVNNAMMVDLEPGDVLFIPNGWWHYVENLTSAISINIWIPQESDDFSRLKECLVKYFIRSVLDDTDPARKDQLLNPNEDDLHAVSIGQIISELQWCLESVPSGKPTEERQSTPELDSLLKNHTLPQTLVTDIKSKRSIPHDCKISASTGTNSTELELIKAFTHPDVVSLAVEKFLERYSSAK